MLTIYTQSPTAQAWIDRHRGVPPVFACVLGFTATGLIPGISAAGQTPEDRQWTAIADAEFLITGKREGACYPLPPLTAGLSPVFISRAVIAALGIPVYLFNAGLPVPPAVLSIDLQGIPANCVSTGQALPLATVQTLFQSGLQWGKKLAQTHPDPYFILGECVVGGTTTALGVLLGLGIPAAGKVSSSHVTCNHDQKLTLVTQGLHQAQQAGRNLADPLEIIAAVGDPMQIVVAGLAIALSSSNGVLLAGGTQMLAVYGLMQALAQSQNLTVHWEQILVGTTDWVCQDATGDCPGLAQLLTPVPLIGAQLSFAHSIYPQLQAYDQGFVKEGVGAGGLAIAAHLYRQWGSAEVLTAIEALVAQTGS